DDAADARQVEERRELLAVAERPGRREHRIAKRDPAEVDGRVDAAHGTPSHASAAASSTGPSRHTSAKPPPARGTAQPRQTPKPHAMRFSSDTTQRRPRAAAISAARRIIPVGPQA